MWLRSKSEVLPLASRLFPPVDALCRNLRVSLCLFNGVCLPLHLHAAPPPTPQTMMAGNGHL